MEYLTVREIIGKAEQSNIHLSTDGIGIEARGLKNAMTSELKQMMRDFKPEIIDALSKSNTVAENNFSEWCSRSCSALVKLNVSTGDLFTCRMENESHV